MDKLADIGASVRGKTFLYILVIAFCLPIASSIFGALYGDFGEDFYVTFAISLVLVLVANILSLFLPGYARQLAKYAYMCCLVIIFILYFILTTDNGYRDADILAILLMIVATYPICLLIQYIINYIDLPMGNEYDIAVLLMVFVAGYFQWFYLLPKIFGSDAGNKR